MDKVVIRCIGGMEHEFLLHNDVESNDAMAVMDNYVVVFYGKCSDRNVSKNSYYIPLHQVKDIEFIREYEVEEIKGD